METLQGIRYTLRMMGVTISGPSYTHGDDMLVTHNTQHPESTLKKNSNFICYHNVCKSVGMRDSLTVNVGSNKNCADLEIKLLYGGKRRFCVSKLLYGIYDDL